ncbi:pirin family protein [Caldiplasma sukawensis]
MEKSIIGIIQGRVAYDGAGVKLLRTFGGPNTFKMTDPFLLMDLFGSDIPQEYEAGFPWHPHRGIETLTYQIKGITDHEDSNGNRGRMYGGDIQSMVAGSGIFHQEMPAYNDEELRKSGKKEVYGVQLWINLRSREKMQKPTYIYRKSSEIETYKTEGGTQVKVIGGKYGDVTGPYVNESSQISYFHFKFNGETITLNEMEGKKILVLGLNGEITVNSNRISRGQVIILSDTGETFSVSGQNGSEAIIIGGKPQRERIAWYGPVVMTTEEELNQAFLDLQKGTFVKDKQVLFV